jgi:hypothetical protein
MQLPASNDLKFRNVANCGDLSIDFIDFRNACGGRIPEKITKTFLKKLVVNTIINSTNYSDRTAAKNEDYRDYIYRYSEKCLHTVICPSIFKISPIFIIEQPSKRTVKGKEAYTGHIDYRVSYKDITFTIELKHARLTYGKAPKKQVGKYFNKAIDQIKGINKSEMEFLCQDNDKYYIKIALELITFRKGNKLLEKLNKADDDIIKDTYIALKEVPALRKANMFALWLPPKRLTKPFEYSNKFVKYPAVAFVAKIID